MRRNGNTVRACETCLQDFWTWPSKIAAGWGRFCSKRCKRRTNAIKTTSVVAVMADGTASVALCDRNGGIRAYAIVDAADASWVAQWRWSLDRNGYATRSEYIGGGNRGNVRNFKLHRELIGLTRGDGLEIDHVNRNKLDNRRSNLRIVPRGAQAQNQSKQIGTASRYRGVSWHKPLQKWRAQIGFNGRKQHLGYFDSESEAAEVARAARARLLTFAVD